MPYAHTTINRNIKFTYEDYCLYPSNGKRLQLIGGEFYMTPAPQTFHQKVSIQIGFILQKHVLEHKLGEVYFAPTDVVFTQEDVVQPDILFIRKERLHIIKKANIKGAPDLVVEILSKSTTKIDRKLKRALYAKHGVREYWIVDPDKKTVEVLQLGKTGFGHAKNFSGTQTISSSAVQCFTVKASEIFK